MHGTASNTRKHKWHTIHASKIRMTNETNIYAIHGLTCLKRTHGFARHAKNTHSATRRVRKTVLSPLVEVEMSLFPMFQKIKKNII